MQTTAGQSASSRHPLAAYARFSCELQRQELRCDTGHVTGPFHPQQVPRRAFASTDTQFKRTPRLLSGRQAATPLSQDAIQYLAMQARLLHQQLQPQFSSSSALNWLRLGYIQAAEHLLPLGNVAALRLRFVDASSRLPEGSPATRIVCLCFVVNHKFRLSGTR
jgi:hypothetical protein